MLCARWSYQDRLVTIRQRARRSTEFRVRERPENCLSRFLSPACDRQSALRSFAPRWCVRILFVYRKNRVRCARCMLSSRPGRDPVFPRAHRLTAPESPSSFLRSDVTAASLPLSLLLIERLYRFVDYVCRPLIVHPAWYTRRTTR